MKNCLIIVLFCWVAHGRGQNLTSSLTACYSLNGNATDAINALNRRQLELTGDPEIATRISNLEMAYQMQEAAPELMDLIATHTAKAKGVLAAYRKTATRALCAAHGCANAAGTQGKRVAPLALWRHLRRRARPCACESESPCLEHDSSC